MALKKITYNGSSKVIIRLCEVVNSIIDGGIGGGHTILDKNGNTMPSEANLQFTGASVTDDAVNHKTVVAVPEDVSDFNNDAGYLTSADVSTVAISGDYDDLLNKPSIPAAQVNSDWDAVSGVAQILNKPTIPTVNDGTLTIQQDGTTLGTFTANQSGNTTVNLTGGSGGHTIWNRIKTALTARSNLWFADAKISDASADDATKVEVLTELADETAFDNLPTDGTADGMYAFPDSGAEYLDASMVGYGNDTVNDALDELTDSDTADVTTGAGTSIAIHLIKKGKLVYLWIESGSFTANANNTIVQLPSGFFPVLICDVRDTYSNKRLNINTDGTIVCKENVSGTILRGTFTYMCS